MHSYFSQPQKNGIYFFTIQTIKVQLNPNRDARPTHKNEVYYFAYCFGWFPYFATNTYIYTCIKPLLLSMMVIPVPVKLFSLFRPCEKAKMAKMVPLKSHIVD